MGDSALDSSVHVFGILLFRLLEEIGIRDEFTVSSR